MGSLFDRLSENLYPIIAGLGISYALYSLSGTIDAYIESWKTGKKLKTIKQKISEYEQENENTKLIIIVNEYANHHTDNIISINNSEAILDVLRKCLENNQTLNIIIHSSGGTIESSDIIVRAILKHKGVINSYIPKYAQSAAALLALSTSHIYLNEYAYLTPTDPQISVPISNKRYMYSSKVLMKYVDTYKKIKTNSAILLNSIEADILHKDNIETITKILDVKKLYNRANIFEVLCSGNVPHHSPLYFDELKNLGFDDYVSEGIPDDINEIFVLYQDLEK